MRSIPPATAPPDSLRVRPIEPPPPEPASHPAATAADSRTPDRLFPAPALPSHEALDRPPHQRLLEHRYRFGQAMVFGLPVWGLQLYGRSLGGPEADRWVAVLQALLAGWVVYVAAAGMMFEGIVQVGRRKLDTDLP